MNFSSNKPYKLQESTVNGITVTKYSLMHKQSDVQYGWLAQLVIGSPDRPAISTLGTFSEFSEFELYAHREISHSCIASGGFVQIKEIELYLNSEYDSDSLPVSFYVEGLLVLLVLMSILLIFFL